MDTRADRSERTVKTHISLTVRREPYLTHQHVGRIFSLNDSRLNEVPSAVK